MAKATSPKVKRKHVRFNPEPGTYALIDFKNEEKFAPDQVALIFEESHGGVGLVIVHPRGLADETPLRVQVGLVAPLAGEVRWCKKLDKNIYHIGVQFLE